MNVPALTRRSLLTGIGASTLLLAAGCKTAVSQAASSSAAPTRGGTLEIAQLSDINPKVLFGQNFVNFAFGRLVYNTLIEYAPGGLTPKPSLATSWTVSADGLTYDFELRDDVSFHSGRAFTAADAVFSLQHIATTAAGSQFKSTAAAVTATATGAHSLRLTLAHPLSNLFDLLQNTFIIDQGTIAGLLAGASANGTGPFKWSSRTPGSSLELVRNAHYFIPDRPYLDAVTVRVIPQAQSLLLSLKAKQTQLALGIAPKDQVSLHSDSSFANYVTDRDDTNYYVDANVKIAPLGDARVRQAISYAVDRASIVSEVFSGEARASVLPWPTSSPAYTAAASAKYGRDLDTARALLGQAGVSGVNVPLVYNSGVSALASIAQIV
jgi:peptide/nickel transport system substrate-binding protein